MAKKRGKSKVKLMELKPGDLMVIGPGGVFSIHHDKSDNNSNLIIKNEKVLILSKQSGNCIKSKKVQEAMNTIHEFILDNFYYDTGDLIPR